MSCWKTVGMLAPSSSLPSTCVQLEKVPGPRRMQLTNVALRTSVTTWSDETSYLWPMEHAEVTTQTSFIEISIEAGILQSEKGRAGKGRDVMESGVSFNGILRES